MADEKKSQKKQTLIDDLNSELLGNELISDDQRVILQRKEEQQKIIAEEVKRANILNELFVSPDFKTRKSVNKISKKMIDTARTLSNNARNWEYITHKLSKMFKVSTYTINDWVRLSKKIEIAINHDLLDDSTIPYDWFLLLQLQDIKHTAGVNYEAELENIIYEKRNEDWRAASFLLSRHDKIKQMHLAKNLKISDADDSIKFSGVISETEKVTTIQSNEIKVVISKEEVEERKRMYNAFF